MRGVVAQGRQPTDELTSRLLASPSMEGLDLASLASVKAPWTDGEGIHVVAYDYGIKRNIVRKLVAARMPSDRGAGGDDLRRKCEQLKPDGLFLSNGPGDPAAVEYAIENIRSLAGDGLADVRHLPRPSAHWPRLRG